MFKVREYQKNDVEEILLINKNNLKIIKIDNFDNEVYNFIVCELDEKIIGYICYITLIDRIEIIDITVSKQYRGKKVGTKLLSYLIDKCDNSNFTDISLEVKNSNSNALSLYKKFNFDILRIIPNYYEKEDGLLMKREYINRQ